MKKIFIDDLGFTERELLFAIGAALLFFALVYIIPRVFVVEAEGVAGVVVYGAIIAMAVLFLAYLFKPKKPLSDEEIKDMKKKADIKLWERMNDDIIAQAKVDDIWYRAVVDMYFEEEGEDFRQYVKRHHPDLSDEIESKFSKTETLHIREASYVKNSPLS